MRSPASSRVAFFALSFYVCAAAHEAPADRNSRQSRRPGLGGFRQGLSELGYVDGRNVTMEWRWSEGKADRYPLLRSSSSNRRWTSSSPRAHRRSGPPSRRRVRFRSDAVSAYPDKIGLVESLARPGGNVTGFSNASAELAGKRLELLKEIAPKVSRVAMLWNPASPVDQLGSGRAGGGACSWRRDPVDRGAYARGPRGRLRDRHCEPCRCLVRLW